MIEELTGTLWGGAAQQKNALATETVGVERTQAFSDLLRPARGKESRPEKKSRSLRPIRRLRGFLISIQGQSARVGFVIEGNVIEYQLPYPPLKKAGITAINQPFEMDEVEEKLPSGLLTGYVYRPMAKASEVVTEYLSDDEKLQKLRAAALSYFNSSP